MPLKDKDAYLVYLANSLAQNSIIIFTRTVNDAARSVELNFPLMIAVVLISHFTQLVFPSF
jgi:hypothetical protein